MFLVLIETSGNQSYIFSTNKLKENIGASELTYQAGTKWVLEAVERETNKLWSLWKTNDQLRDKLLDTKTLNVPIELSSNNKVEVIIATSGKALLLTQDEQTAKNIIQYVTCKALKEAPGLDICGVIEKLDWQQDDLGEINRKIHQNFQYVRSKKPSLDLRFLRLPVVAQCSTSGFPASDIETDAEKELVYRSAITRSKINFSSDGFERITALIPDNINVPRSVRALNQELENQDWLAVIHADGNGLGEVFLNFEKHIKDSTLNWSQANRNYVDKLRKFSIALDICTEKAFLSALSAFPPVKEKFLPVIPLILGGDDLTVICDGRSALKFTQMFLSEFEKETKCQNHLNGIIPEIAGEALKANRLSACAGVAIIKNNFPFSVAYKLAEKLMKSAKKVKNKVTNSEGKPYPCSALDFHILYDSSDVELSKIREKIVLTNNGVKTKLYNKPYVVTPMIDIQEANDLDWAKFHQWEKLQEKVDVILAPDLKNEGRRLLPNSQIHELRAGLFLGKEGADARYQLIRGRYKGIEKLEGEPDSLFEKEETDSEIYTTSLLDAIDAAEFLQLGDKNHG